MFNYVYPWSHLGRAHGAVFGGRLFVRSASGLAFDILRPSDFFLLVYAILMAV